MASGDLQQSHNMILNHSGVSTATRFNYESNTDRTDHRGPEVGISLK